MLKYYLQGGDLSSETDDLIYSSTGARVAGPDPAEAELRDQMSNAHCREIMDQC